MFSDEGKVSQILRNFISNALKFTERGEIRVSARLVGDHEMLFSVADTGIGIEPQNLNLIFEDFGQVDHPIQRRVRGTGLGLPLSKKLATLLGGRVEVESRPGVGSEFSVILPIRHRESAPEYAPVFQFVPDPSTRTVLVVEDSPEMMLMYKSYLKGSGFQVLPAATTREADEILDGVKPAAIVLDIILRSEDSWAFAARLKSEDRTKDIPLLVASTIEDQTKAFHLGVDRYLVKPIERARLVSELREAAGLPSLTHVLIIDDEERFRYVLKQHLRKLPLLVSEASSGLDGFRSACKLHPDFIFLDLGMPDASGFEILEKLKNEAAVASIPVIIVTSGVLTSSERSRLMHHAVEIFNKDKLEQADFARVLQLSTELDQSRPE
jgi:CheY-like chemotaxis protein